MKKTSIFATLAFVCLFATSCTDNMHEPVLESNENREYHGVPLEEALQHLNGFLSAVEKPTRSSATRRIESVKVVRSKDFVTRSIASGVANADSLIYVVNFEDNQGFAYLAADDRISTPVIYVADDGNTPMNGFPPIIRTRPIYEGYPLNGPGIFTDNNVAPGQLFMNPNTFSFFYEGDVLVGDFFLNGETEYNAMIDQINQYTLNYVENELNQQDPIEQEVIFNENPDFPEPPIISKTYASIDTVVNVYNLLEKTYSWEQDFPFNKYCPEVTNWCTGETKIASAGCVALATAKILAFNKYPEAPRVNNFVINWNTLLNNLNSPVGIASAGYITKDVRDKCLTICFFSGTFTFPSAIATYLRNKGYTNVNYCNYNDDDVKNMLDNNHPLFICSVPEYESPFDQLENSHAWNIDGYLMKTTTYTTYYYKNNILFNTVVRKENSFMVHCDWGWGGALNGYFTSGVFDHSDSNVLYDNKAHKGAESTNYKWYKKIITYDIP